MGNQQSNYPERMLKLKNVQDLNNDIDDFNTKQLNQKAMDALGFLIQFEEINYGGFKGIFKKIFFQQALSKIDINTNMLLDNKPYFFKLRVIEMYTLAELLGRYTEDADFLTNKDLTQAQKQALSQIKIGRNNNKQNQQQNNQNEEEQKQADKIVTQPKQINQQNQQNEEEDKQCPLCLDERIKIILPCLHGYCDNCARKWIQEKQQKNCPMCRFQVESTQSRFNRTVMHIEDDVENVNQLVKNQIIQIILSKNEKIPLIIQNKD
ncbi:hypothetical protein ABPG72_001084 [Tetrahymena utriculariae]